MLDILEDAMELALLLFFAVTARCAEDFNDSPWNFYIELFTHTAQRIEGDVVISPFGLWTLMTAVALGASGKSYEQLATALNLPGNEADVINGYKLLSDVVLNPSTYEVQLTSKNFVFLDQSLNVLPDFTRTIQDDFGAEVMELDFRNPNSADVANSYIEKSSGCLKNVLKPDNFRESRMILTNVVSFKGLWSSPFNKSDTVKEPFYDAEGTIIGSINMMYQKGPFPFSNIKELQSFVLEIPYGNDGKYSMIFLMPYPKIKVSEVNRNLANFGVKNIFKTLQNDVDDYGLEDIDVKIPRFHITTNVEMKKPLNDLGVYDIFEPNLAEFERLTGEGIFVSTIVHKADIEVTEAGTVASAVSTAEFEDRIASPTFYANRPFIYCVIEKSTTTVLFSGIYSNPTEF